MQLCQTVLSRIIYFFPLIYIFFWWGRGFLFFLFKSLTLILEEIVPSIQPNLLYCNSYLNLFKIFLPFLFLN